MFKFTHVIGYLSPKGSDESRLLGVICDTCMLIPDECDRERNFGRIDLRREFKGPPRVGFPRNKKWRGRPLAESPRAQSPRQMVCTVFAKLCNCL